MRPPIPALLVACSLAWSKALLAAPQDNVDFVAQVRPIFQKRCVECHGPKEQEADLRLDRRSSVFPGGSDDEWVIVRGDPQSSELYARITLPADDPDVMPNEGPPLSTEQIALIRAWIEQGAEWPEGADAPAVEAAPPPVETFALPELDDRQRAARQKAIDAVQARGALAMQVAADTDAVDVNFSLVGAAVTDADLRLVEGLEPTLVWLNLSRTGITSDGLARLSALGELRRLNLSRTKVGDAGLRHLAGLGKLEYLNLYGTEVTDAGLEHLRGLGGLKKLYLWQTGVTDAGAARLRQALPGLQIDLGRYAEEILAVARAVRPVNAVCPMTDKPVDPAHTFEHEGKVVGFCCQKCRNQFAQDPAKFADKVVPAEPAAERAAAGPVNDECPVSGKPVDPAHVFTYQDRVVAFCCGKCRARFAEDPAKYADKLPK